MPSVCAQCAFGDSQTPVPTYAAAVLGGEGNSRALLHKAQASAADGITACLTAHCRQCRCVTWLARQPTLHDSLVDFSRRLDERRVLLLMAGKSVLSS